MTVTLLDHRRTPPRDRLLARAVTYGVVGVLLLAGLTQVEAWPLTAYRLFSLVRTDTTTALELVAVGQDGRGTVVRPEASNPVVAATSHLYRDLESASPARRTEMVRAWAALAGLDPTTLTSVRLERVTRTFDPVDDAWREHARSLVVEVVL